MGFFGTILGLFGFGVGISIGLVAGYFLFIYVQPNNVEVSIYLLWFIYKEISESVSYQQIQFHNHEFHYY